MVWEILEKREGRMNTTDARINPPWPVWTDIWNMVTTCGSGFGTVIKNAGIWVGNRLKDCGQVVGGAFNSLVTMISDCAPVVAHAVRLFWVTLIRAGHLALVGCAVWTLVKHKEDTVAELVEVIAILGHSVFALVKSFM